MAKEATSPTAHARTTESGGAQETTTTTAEPTSLAEAVMAELPFADAALLKQLKGSEGKSQTPKSKSQEGTAATAEEEETKTAPVAATEEEEESTETAETETTEEEEEDEQEQEQEEETTEGKTAKDKVPAFTADKTKLEPEALKQVEAMESALKAIPRLTAQKHALREERDTIQGERDTLKGELEELRNAPTRMQPSASDPLAHLATEEELDNYVARAQATVQWAKANRKGTTVKGRDGSDVEYTADEMTDIRENAEAIIKDQAPRKREWFERRNEAAKQAKKLYPKLATEHAKRAQDLRKAKPWLEADPERDLIIGRMLLAEDVEKGRMVALPKKATAEADKSVRSTEKPASRPALSTATTTPPAKPAGSKPNLDPLREKALKSQSIDDVTRLVLARFGGD